MKTGRQPVLTMLRFATVVVLIFLIMQPYFILLYGSTIDVLFPKGIIALEQRNLLFIIQLLMTLVIVPVYILTFVFSWKYSATNPKGKYDPDLVDSMLAEVIWWGLPIIIVIIISVLTWVKTHELDPFKPIQSDKKAMTIQVVALQWKWLFIYPEEKIASTNVLKFPEKTPIRFEIAADAPMNSFWIPRLAGQIYAMPGMKTELNLIADSAGVFRGSSANLSGEGFANMYFMTHSTSEEDFRQWVESAKQSSLTLDKETYKEIAKPSQDHPEDVYQLDDDTLFEHIVHKYMHPPEEEQTHNHTHQEN
jgi:cytochrome o ubiquinol oxidase subunit 2